MSEPRVESQKATEYVVLVALDNTPAIDLNTLAFKVHGNAHQASSGDHAKRAAIKSSKALAASVEKGEAVLVAVPARSWQPRRAVSKQRDPVLEV